MVNEINNGTRYLMITNGSQQAKELISSVDLFINHSDESYITTREDGVEVVKPVMNFKVNSLHHVNLKKTPRYEFINDLKPETVDEMFIKKDKPESDYYQRSKLYLVDSQVYTHFNNKKRCTQYWFKRLDYVYREIDPLILTDMANQYKVVHFGITNEELSRVRFVNEYDNFTRYMYYYYQDSNGNLRRVKDNSLMEGEVVLMFTVSKMGESQLYTLMYNEEYISEKCTPLFFYEDVHVVAIKQFLNTFKNQFCNQVFVGVDKLVGKYNLHVSRDTFDVELFTSLQQNEWDNDACVDDHLDKLPASCINIKSPLPYTMDPKTYRVSFDTSKMLPGEKSYFVVQFDFGELFNGFNRTIRLRYEYLIVKQPKDIVIEEQSSPYTTYSINWILKPEYDNVRFEFDDITKVEFCKD